MFSDAGGLGVLKAGTHARPIHKSGTGYSRHASLPPKQKSEMSQSYLKGILPVNQHTYMCLTDNSRPLVRFFIF